MDVRLLTFFLSDGMLRHPYVSRVLPDISDHMMVCLSLHFHNVSLTLLVTTSHIRTSNEQVMRQSLMIGRRHIGAFVTHIQDPARTTNELWQEFKNIILDCINKYVPDRTKKRQINNRWITRKIIHKKKDF